MALLVTISRTQFATRPVFVYLKLMPDLRIYILCLISCVEGMFPSTSTVPRPALIPVGCSSFFGTTRVPTKIYCIPIIYKWWIYYLPDGWLVTGVTLQHCGGPRDYLPTLAGSGVDVKILIDWSWRPFGGGWNSANAVDFNATRSIQEWIGISISDTKRHCF